MTLDAANLMEKMDYHGSEQVVISNGASLTINHVGNSKFHPFSCSSPLILNNLLHVPNITKNLLSVAQFAKDIFLNFTLYLLR